MLLGALLLRSSSPNTFGGPDLAFGLGRSETNFHMEPNRGITLDDVVGVNEAKHISSRLLMSQSLGVIA
ncbi:unnamed protein product [Lactuca virosa]|uniref:Uncharacterized protein n=1 Tax=Lactuca virosa TaxID=75947 RepID=A0AAU9PSU3_9ASTR|nr:unnamed protein product [Lactuca virosa]